MIDKAQLIALLQSQLAQNQANSERQHALDTLRQVERDPNFCCQLLDIVQDRSQEEHTRLVAIITLKHFVGRHWKKRGRIMHDVTPLHDNADEKSRVREKVLQLMDEPSNTVATHLCLLVSKIMRCDFPQQWPELQPTLCQLLSAGTDLQRQRACMALHYILKEMVTMSMPSQRRTFYELSNVMFGGCCQMWMQGIAEFMKLVQEFQSNPNQGGARIEGRAEWYNLTTKVMQKLLVDGTPEFENNAQATQFLEHVYQGVKQLQAIYVSLAEIPGMIQGDEAHPVLDVTCALMKRMLKIIVQLQERRTTTFFNHGCCKPFIQFALEYLYCLRGIQHRQVACMPLRMACQLVQTYTSNVESFLQGDNLKGLVQTVVTDFLSMTNSELQEWSDNPEEYVYECEEVDSGGDMFTVRHSVQSLFLVLLQQYPQPVCQCLIELQQQIMSNPPTTSPEHMLKWDCIYQAMGIACYTLPDAMDANAMLVSVILPQISSPDTNKILKRRAAWLLGQWAGSLPQGRQVFYTALITTIQNSNGDLVVRLTALKALAWLVDDLGFDPAEFSPFVASLMETIFQFMQASRNIDVRLSLVSLITLLISKMHDTLLGYAERLLGAFSTLWQVLAPSQDAASPETLLKGALVGVMTSLVQALGPHSVQVHSLVLPMIHQCTDLNNPSTAVLLEPGLDLWKHTLQCAPTISDDLLQCFEQLPAMATTDSECLSLVLTITDSYILLGQRAFMARHSPRLIQILKNLLEEIRDQGLMQCTCIMDTLLHVFPAEAPEALKPILVTLMQRVLTGKEWDLILANYLCVFARILIINKPWFVGFVGEHLPAVLDKWIDLHDSLTTSYHRKLSCLALLSLLPAPLDDTVLVPRLDAVFHLAIDGIAAENGDWAVDLGPHTVLFEDDLPENCPEQGRRMEVAKRDVVLNEKVKIVLEAKLAEWQRMCGAEAVQRVLSDQTLKGSLQAVLSGTNG